MRGPLGGHKETVLGTRIHHFNCGPWPAETGWLRWVARVLRVVIPQANPDFEGRYEHVTNWWLEVDDSGLVQREIGFDPTGDPLVAAPLGKNLGVFTDSDGAPEPLGELIEPGEFERMWSEFQNRGGIRP
jgi:hypothetical protein